MLSRIETRLRRWRRRFSRSEWLAHLLRLPLSTDTKTETGLVMIQIDGLAHGELEEALRTGEMPFLNRLIRHEHYQLHQMYSGLPSTTPAMQGELFYGTKAGVPGYNFMQSDTKQLVRMVEPAAAIEVEEKLKAARNRPLLEGGSCYCDNFTGGAIEPNFCPSSLGWGSALRDTHPLILLFLILSNAYSFVRTAVLLLLEAVLALIDFGRGLIEGRDLWSELAFIPIRVLIVILLRELITIGAKIDVARGLPIIHINFLGYDEQAHRRGPASLFAHWTLKGIDDAIVRIWRASHRSDRRCYDVWIYSDHGQQQVRPYEKVHGKCFAEAAADVFSRYHGIPVLYRSSGRAGIQLQRVQMLGGERTQRFLARLLAKLSNRKYPPPVTEPEAELTVAPLGPIAHLYYNRPLSARQLSDLASALVTEAKVPAVLFRDATGVVSVTTEATEFSLADNPAAMLGVEHPYLADACKDLTAMCQHSDAGALIAFGYCPGSPAVSFAMENGAHGGPSVSETSAFALTPADIILDAPKSDGAPAIVRPLDLRHAALGFLNRHDQITKQKTPYIQPAKGKQAENVIRLMTYNVHSCIGMDGKLSPERIARLIAQYAPDIIALQELDLCRLRTDNTDQAYSIARYLQMKFHFGTALHIEEERYGNAIFSHLPMRLLKSAILPGMAEKPQLESRAAIAVAIAANGTEIQLINTHLGLYNKEREAQVQCLLGSDWLGNPENQVPTILCGDFNTSPRSKQWRELHERLPDAQVNLANHNPRNTFSSRLPSARIDHVFVDKRIELLSIETPSTALVRLASDHLPLIVTLRLNPE